MSHPTTVLGMGDKMVDLEPLFQNDICNAKTLLSSSKQTDALDVTNYLKFIEGIVCKR